MKKKNIPSVMLLFIIGVTITTAAQSQKTSTNPFKKGSATVNLGIGVGTDYKNEYNAAFGTKVALEFGIWPAGPGVISLGPEAGATISSNSSKHYRDDFNAHTFVIAARSAWHFGWNVPGLDTYAGLSGGMGFHHYDYYDNRRYDYDDVIPVVGGFAGISYFFTPTFGVNAEAGFDITSVQGGLVFKLR